jgi:hypothetical protein
MSDCTTCKYLDSYFSLLTPASYLPPLGPLFSLLCMSPYWQSSPTVTSTDRVQQVLAMAECSTCSNPTNIDINGAIIILPYTDLWSKLCLGCRLGKLRDLYASFTDWKALLSHNVAFLLGEIDCYPSHLRPLDEETGPLVPGLIKLHEYGIMTCCSQPSSSATESTEKRGTRGHSGLTCGSSSQHSTRQSPSTKWTCLSPRCPSRYGILQNRPVFSDSRHHCELTRGSAGRYERSRNLPLPHKRRA